jgi:hypothetical protein
MLAGCVATGGMAAWWSVFWALVQSLRDGDFARVKVCHLETTQHKVRLHHVL